MKLKNIPNILSVIRICLVFVFIFCFFFGDVKAVGYSLCLAFHEAVRNT